MKKAEKYRQQEGEFDPNALLPLLREFYGDHVVDIEKTISYIRTHNPTVTKTYLDEIRERHVAFHQASLLEVDETQHERVLVAQKRLEADGFTFRHAY